MTAAPHRPPFRAAALAAILLAAAAGAAAAVPSPLTSTLPACFAASPDGAFTASVIVRDLANFPVAGSTVTLDFSACSFFVPCTPACTGCTTNAPLHTVSKVTDVNGVARFDLRLGGVCPNERAVVSADGVLLGNAAYSTLDPNGDMNVTGADYTIVQAEIGAGDKAADFNCSGTPDATDLGILAAHFGATCSGVVGTPRRSWGRVKGAYR